MKKTIIILAAILLALILAPAIRGTSLQKSFIPADTEWLLHLDMEKYTSTQLNGMIMKEKGTTRIKKKSEKFARKYKIDLLKDVKGVTIYGKGTEDEKAVVCINGKFDRNYLLNLLKEETSYREIPYGKYIIYNWEEDFGTFASDQLILLSEDEEAIKTSLDVISGKKKNITSSPLISSINEIPSDAFLMAAVGDISSITKNREKPVVLKKMGKAVFSIMEKQENLALKLNFDVKSVEDAEQIEQIIIGLIAMVNMHQEEKDSKLRLSKSIKVTTKDKNVQLELIYPTAALVEMSLGKRKICGLFIPEELGPLT